jgi:hypothetical protein
MKLVENVGCDTSEYVGVGEIFPEWFVDRTDAFVLECVNMSASPFLFKNPEGSFLVSHGKLHWLPTLRWSYSTFRAKVFLTVCHKTLFRVISNIRGQYRVDQTSISICASHHNTFSACLNQWLEDLAHAVME